MIEISSWLCLAVTAGQLYGGFWFLGRLPPDKGAGDNPRPAARAWCIRARRD